MADYLDRLEYLSETATYSEYAPIRVMLLWICRVRPDGSGFESIVSSITHVTYNANGDVKIANAQMAFLKRTSKVVLHFPRLDYDSLRLICYTNGGFANRADKNSQIGFGTCLADKNGAMCIVSFLSYKGWSVCRSAMVSETLAFVEAFDSTLHLDLNFRGCWGVMYPLSCSRILDRSST
jgi:hypothetical protein